jgi:NAD(P)-dependent dehydrogenase (short-subunit alcohol dehydrogenase family)
MATDRFALVTGGGVRVGRAISEGLAEHGLHVAVHYNSSSKAADETVAAIEARGRQAFSVPGDLRDANACATLVDRVIQRFGALDVIVNSAASFRQTPIGDPQPTVWDEVYGLNVRAPFLIVQAAAARLREDGCVINVADLAGLQAWPSYLAHGSSKAALINLTRSLSRALGPKIRVNAIAPGAVLLPEGFSKKAAEKLINETPLKRLGAPSDVVNAVRYLVDADFVTGALLVVDGGRSAH